MEGLLTPLALLALAGAIVWYGRTQAAARMSSRAGQPDNASLVILFNTMRDLLQQQKDLARRVNESLNGKVAAVREAAALATESMDRLRDMKRSLLGELEELRAEVAGLQRETDLLREHRGRSAALEPADDDESLFETEEELHPPRLTPVPVETPEGALGNAIEEWVATPRNDDPSAPEPIADIEPLAGMPEYTESSREALRSLLGLDGPGLPPGDEPKPRAARPAPLPANNSNGSNGRAVPATVHARVQEYHKAGMSVTQIAQELGLGKGEVRLILGLRKGRRR